MRRSSCIIRGVHRIFIRGKQEDESQRGDADGGRERRGGATPLAAEMELGAASL